MPATPFLSSQAIFLGAAGVSALATVAFLIFVPSHPTGSAERQQQQQQQQQQEGAVPAAKQQAPQPRPGVAEQARALWRDVSGMGAPFWRVLAVIGLYGLGHINESLLEARAIEVRAAPFETIFGGLWAVRGREHAQTQKHMHTRKHNTHTHTHSHTHAHARNRSALAKQSPRWWWPCCASPSACAPTPWGAWTTSTAPGE